ncbi:alpha/beta hydrolase [Halomonas sediminis]
MISAQGTEHRIRLADERTLACLELGDPKGAPVIYFHGFPGSRLEAGLAADAAQRLGLRLFAPDRPGFGESTFLPSRTISNWAADVAELTDQLGLQRFAVVGVSGGGPYALACAARIPRRLHGVAIVGALAPLAGMRSTRGMLARNRLALALAAYSPTLARLVIEPAARWVRRRPARFIARMAADAPVADRAVLADEGYRAIFTASTAEALRQGGHGPALELALLARAWGFELQEVSIPVRIWQGLSDNIVPPAMAQRLAAKLPRSETHWLPAEGHLSVIVRRLDAVLEDLCR